MAIQSELLQPAFYPRSILRALWKRKLSIFLIWLCGTAATVGVVYSLRPVYRAEALVLVESQKIPENFVAPTVQTQLEARLDRLKQQVLSNERLWSLIQELNLYPEARAAKTREEVLELMHQDITIGLERGWSANRPGAFRVAYEAFSPTVAAEVANRMSNFFIKENVKEREQEATGTSEFLDSTLQEASEKLQEQEAKLSQFKQTYNGELPEQQNGLLATIGQSRVELVAIQDSLGRAQQNKLTLEQSLAAAQDSLRTLQELVRRRNNIQNAVVYTPSGEAKLVVADPPSQAETDLAAAQNKLSQLQLRYSDKHREVQAQMAEVARLRDLVKTEKARRPQQPAVASAPAPVVKPVSPQDAADFARNDDELVLSQERINNLKSQVAGTVREISDLEQRHKQLLLDVEEVQKHLRNIPIREQQLASITRDYDTSKANYRQMLDKKLAADTAANMERWQKAEGFVMLNEAPVPEKPVRPRRMLLIAAGTGLSLLLAGAIAFLREMKSNVLLGEWELPAGTLVIGQVSKISLPVGRVLLAPPPALPNQS